jgi:hypothetical protein
MRLFVGIHVGVDWSLTYRSDKKAVIQQTLGPGFDSM